LSGGRAADESETIGVDLDGVKGDNRITVR